MKLVVFLTVATLAESSRLDSNRVARELSASDDQEQALDHKQDLANSTAACHCTCTKSFTPAFFKTAKHDVNGYTLTPGIQGGTYGKAFGGIHYYVEVRHISPGKDDSSFKLFRKCDHSYCNKPKRSQECGDSVLDGASTVEFLKKELQEHGEEFKREANAKIEMTTNARQGWHHIVLGKDSMGVEVVPSILTTSDPDVVVAVYWTTTYGGSSKIADQLTGWGSRFTPDKGSGKGSLAWGFQEVLDDPEGTHVEVPDSIKEETKKVPKGMQLSSTHTLVDAHRMQLS